MSTHCIVTLHEHKDWLDQATRIASLALAGTIALIALRMLRRRP